MTGDFQSAFMSFFYRCTQFVPRDVHVRFERCSAKVCPKVHHASRVFWPSKLVHNGSECTWTFEVWRRDMHLGPDHATGINQALDLKVGIRSYAAAGANRGDAKSEIQTWEAATHVRVHRWGPAHGKEHVVMHSHETGEYCVSGEIKRLCIPGYLRRSSRFDGLDFSSTDHERLIIECGCSGAINDAHMGQRNHRCFSTNELLTILLCVRTDGGSQQNHEDTDFAFHRSSFNGVMSLPILD